MSRACLSAELLIDKIYGGGCYEFGDFCHHPLSRLNLEGWCRFMDKGKLGPETHRSSSFLGGKFSLLIAMGRK